MRIAKFYGESKENELFSFKENSSFSWVYKINYDEI